MTMPLDHLIEAVLPAGLAVARVVAERVEAAVKENYGSGVLAMLAAIRRVLDAIVPIYAGVIQDSVIAGWVIAALPMVEASVGSQYVPPPIAATTAEVAPVGIIRLPKIEGAVRWLSRQRPVTRGVFDALDADAKAGAFTVSGAANTEAVEKIQAALVQDIGRGGTLRDFQKLAKDALKESPLSPARLENIYRTNVARAYTAGQQAMLQLPLVRSEFPYVLYTATHDSRVGDIVPGLDEPTHLMMESLGIDGGPVYRADDPVIIKFWPPWRWQCRCHAIPISLENAANRYGVSEAKEWLRTGVDPKRAYVKHPPFDLPEGWVPLTPGRFTIAA